MPTTMHDLGIDRLNFEDRIALAEEIWESVVQEFEQTPLIESQRQELGKRLADSIARPDAVIPWEVVKVEALARVSR